MTVYDFEMLCINAKCVNCVIYDNNENEIYRGTFAPGHIPNKIKRMDLDCFTIKDGILLIFASNP